MAANEAMATGAIAALNACLLSSDTFCRVRIEAAEALGLVSHDFNQHAGGFMLWGRGRS